jgi:hypothetical protein
MYLLPKGSLSPVPRSGDASYHLTIAVLTIHNAVFTRGSCCLGAVILVIAAEHFVHETQA